LKKKITFVCLFLLGFLINIYSNELPKNELKVLRTLLYESTESEDSLNSLFAFISILSKKNDIIRTPLLLAYRGVGKALMAEYSFFPWNKLEHVNKGIELLDKAVEMDSSNLEIRFLRFTVLSNIPFFLGYSSEADSDAIFLYELLKSGTYNEDKELIKNVVRFLLESERLDKNKQEDLSLIYNIALK